ncbi:MAG TPA: glutamate-5-semialdehyde dehydrogenase [Spirochaetales bacterium]|nr:glutamate-5-semialdehyde dehydrogenase [Spirochaetales bacterium]
MVCRTAAEQAKKASIPLGALKREEKDRALSMIRDVLWENREKIFSANQLDLDRSEKEHLASPLLKRLKFDEPKLKEVCSGLESLIRLPDPIGRVLSARELDIGLELYQVTCPIGVIGIIFESRPDALVQISSLCLKSGNAALLKGGREARETNRMLYTLITEASRSAGIPEGWITLLETREDVSELLKLDTLVDLIIPRGSNEFVRHILNNSSIPVLGHAEGICHLYIDSGADLDMAVRITVDAKTQYPSVCNAIETLLVHREQAPSFLPRLVAALQNVELRGCSETQAIIPCKAATEEDWRAEYLDYILSIKIVGSLEEAIQHINTYGSRHTDGIVTPSRERAEFFMERVDSADVFWNASTRFSDGYRYGLGAEVGIATGKLHARGPVGLEGLTTYKWRLYGKGHTVAPYTGSNPQPFSHRDLPPELPPVK